RQVVQRRGRLRERVLLEQRLRDAAAHLQRRGEERHRNRRRLRRHQLSQVRQRKGVLVGDRLLVGQLQRGGLRAAGEWLHRRSERRQRDRRRLRWQLRQVPE